MNTRVPRLISIMLSIILFSSFIPIRANASSIETCETYDAANDILAVKCNMNFIQLSSELNDTSKISYLGNGEWLLNTTIVTDIYTTFSINSENENVKWIKITNNHGIIIGGRGEINRIKITSWDTTGNTTVGQNRNRTIPRGYISFRSSYGGFVNNSDIGYLGYKTILFTKGISGVSFDDSHDIILFNNKFHDNYFAFYSKKSYNITIDNNEYYDNILYAIDPHSGSYGIKIINNSVHDNYKFGIIISLKCSNFTIENNTIHDNNKGNTISYGIFFSRISDANVARNNTIYNESVGIIVSQSSNNDIYNNRISNTTRGLYVRSGAEAMSTDNFIHDNVITDTGLNIDIVNARGNIYKNNTNSFYGIMKTEFDNYKYTPSYFYKKVTCSIISGEKCVSTNVTKQEIEKVVQGVTNGNYVKPSQIKNSTVIITFDDGSKTVYDNAFPTLKKNNQRAVAYVVASRPGKSSNNYMNWSDLTKLYNLGWDISSHTVNHVDLTTLSDLRLIYELKESRNILMSHGFTRSDKFIAYPFGSYNEKVVKAVKENGYAMGRTIERQNISSKENYLYTTKVFELHNDTSIAATKNAINETIRYNGNLILVYHMIVPDEYMTQTTQVKKSDFKIISDYIASRNDDISVITMSEYYDSIVQKQDNKTLGNKI